MPVQIGEGDTRLKQHQNLYEAVRADRNLYSKNLIQAQDEIQEMKRKFKIMVGFIVVDGMTWWGPDTAKIQCMAVLGSLRVADLRCC